MGASAPPHPRVESSPRLLVFTDLDGTLLDHDDYSWEPARPALERLRAGGHPVVLTSSKTLAEVAVLQDSLGLTGPVISENGALLALPLGLVPDTGLEVVGPWRVHRRSPPYAKIVEALAELRDRRGYRFQGFADLTVDDVVGITGLTHEAARAAHRRDGSEPLLWQDAPERLAELDLDLGGLGLRRTTGGRFHHVLGAGADKAEAMGDLRRILAESGRVYSATVALGDGPNDRGMLAAADYPVLVANPRAPVFDTSDIPGLICTRGLGPHGWAEAITTLLDDLTTDDRAGDSSAPADH